MDLVRVSAAASAVDFRSDWCGALRPRRAEEQFDLTPPDGRNLRDRHSLLGRRVHQCRVDRPAANQKFRVSLAGAAVPRSASELSLGELQALLEPGAEVHARLAIPAGPRLARIYYSRWGLCPSRRSALSMLALSLSARLRANATIAMVSVCGLYFGYYFVTPALKPYLSPLAFGWLPNIVVTLATIILAALLARGVSLLPAP